MKAWSDHQWHPPTGVGGCSLWGTTSLARIMLLAAAVLATGWPAHAQDIDTRPAEKRIPPHRPAAFQPGVLIDWRAPAVLVDSHVALRRGPLEFFACGPGKEHESILRLDAAAVHIYMALGLIGLQPGHPPEWDETRADYGRPAGDLLTITCEWHQGDQARQADAFDWLQEIEYARKPRGRPWVFGGSLRRPDRSLVADRSGAVVALVDFPESLITLSRGHPSDYSAMWVAANTAKIPPSGTRVRLVLRPARPQPFQVVLDFRGDLRVNQRYCRPPDLADALLLARQLEPERVQPILAAGAWASDVRRVHRALLAAGCQASAFSFQIEPPTNQP